jgi:hypothetical protein
MNERIYLGGSGYQGHYWHWEPATQELHEEFGTAHTIVGYYKTQQEAQEAIDDTILSMQEAYCKQSY